MQSSDNSQIELYLFPQFIFKQLIDKLAISQTHQIKWKFDIFLCALEQYRLHSLDQQHVIYQVSHASA